MVITAFAHAQPMLMCAGRGLADGQSQTAGGESVASTAGPPQPEPDLRVASERERAPRRRQMWFLLPILGVALVVHLWGIQRDLPYVTEDQTWIVRPALRIAASGDFNPHEFSYPGSTLIYPLAAADHVWNAIAYGGSWFHSDAHITSTFAAHASGFLLIGRLLTLGYAVMSVPVVYAVGCMAFGGETALIGALLAALHPTDVFDKRITTNSATAFFYMLGLLACLRVWRRPSTTNQIIAGAVIGLAIATKYPLGTLVACLIMVDAMVLWQYRAQPQQLRSVMIRAALGLAAVPLGFLLATPYFLVELSTVTKDLALQMRTQHLGADGLSFAGNFIWYLSQSIPSTLRWPQMIAAIFGIAVALWRRRSQQIALLIFALIFLCGISSSYLHWDRWLIPILPVCALFAAHGLRTAVAYAAKRLAAPPLAQYAGLAGAVLLAVGQPAYSVMHLDRASTNPSTYVLARQWVEANLPAGSALVYEWDTLPPPVSHGLGGVGVWVNRDHGRTLIEFAVPRLSVARSLEFYLRQGYRYFVTSSLLYVNYPADPQQHPREAAFYNELLSRGRLLHQIDAAPSREGSTIRIYEIAAH